MIDTKDLRIGNYLLFVDKQIEILGIDASIVNRDTPHVLFQNTGDDRIMAIALEELLPIELTANWLKVLGFFYKDGAAEYGEERKNGVHLYVHDEDRGYFHFSLGVFHGTKVEIKYLHQLQNLYYSLTGEELTIKTD